MRLKITLVLKGILLKMYCTVPLFGKDNMPSGGAVIWLM